MVWLFKDGMSNPKDVSIGMVDGEVCFQTILAVAWKPKDEFDQKDLDVVAKGKFSIEQFEEKQPAKKGMYQIVKTDSGKAYYLRLFPFKTDKSSWDLDFILKVMNSRR
jgi:hypothetical protein